MEGRIALEETLKRYPEWEVDHPHVVRLHTSTVRGFARVPIMVSTGFGSGANGVGGVLPREMVDAARDEATIPADATDEG